ncbi:hypothetical protein MMC11_007925 [Xylographa trunciseda]|nr:hypothetical protein [Xylographa trunciseda]
MLHAKYVSANKNQLWMNGLLVTVPKGGLLCQVVLGQDEPGVNKYCWTTQCYDGEYGLRMPTPIAPRSLPGFVNLHPSAPVSLLSLHAYPQDVTGSLHPAAKHTNQTVWKKWKKWIKMKLFRGSG